VKYLLECLYTDTGSDIPCSCICSVRCTLYRDSYHEIRALCIGELGVWMNTYRCVMYVYVHCYLASF